MAVQLSVAVRNARLDAIETVGGTTASFSAFSGAVPADCTAANPTGLLTTFNLPSDWMNAASSGTKTLLGSWTQASASGTGTPVSFRFYTSTATKDGTTCFMQGDAAVGSGSLNFNGSITAGQTVTVTAFTLTDANA